MSDAFTLPEGDAAGLTTAARGFESAASGISTDAGTAKAAVATALSEWNAPRTVDFRDAGAGMQVQLVTVATALGRVSEALKAYARALTDTRADVAGYASQATSAQHTADTRSKAMKPDDPEQDRLFQHTAMRVGQLRQQALTAKANLHTLAMKIAATIDLETDMAVPQSAKLSPAEIRRRVDSSLGVAGIQKAAADGSLTSDQAWAALHAAQMAIPKDAVNDDGSVDWKKAVAEFNDKYLGPPNLVGATAPAPSEGWALYRLLLNQREVAAVTQDLRTAFDDIVGPVALDMDRGLAGLNDINDALIRMKALSDAVDALGPSSETARAIESAAAGGLPETGLIGVLGKVAGGLAVLGDVMTIVDPGVENKTEGNVLRGAAAVNIVGTGMAFAGTLGPLVGINAVADWIPGVGEVVMIGTGLFLAGDYVYHHWDEIKHGLSTAYNATTHALGTAYHATTQAVGTAYHATTQAVGTAYHATTHALGAAASATGHALSSVGHGIGSVFHHVF